jgi:hypothetical protein
MKCWSTVVPLLSLLLLLAAPALAAAQDEEANIEFFYSLVTKRPVIEREIEFGFSHEKGDEGRETEMSLGIEFPIMPWWQLEVEVPVVIADPREGTMQAGFGDLEVQNKFLLYKSVEHRILVSAGFEVTLPSGSERRGLGGAFAIEPFITAGIGFGPFELLANVAWEQHLEVDHEGPHEQTFEANAALGWLISNRFVALVEVNTVTNLRGEDDPLLAKKTQVYLTPGFNVRVAPGTVARFGVQLPVTRAREFDYALKAGLTWEF